MTPKLTRVKLRREQNRTRNMNWSPHEAVVIEETGGPLSQQHLHAAGVAFLSSQVEHGASRRVLHVHVGCGLRQHAQRLPVSLIGLASGGKGGGGVGEELGTRTWRRKR